MMMNNGRDFEDRQPIGGVYPSMKPDSDGMLMFHFGGTKLERHEGVPFPRARHYFNGASHLIECTLR